MEGLIQWEAEPITLVCKLVEVAPSPYTSETDAKILISKKIDRPEKRRVTGLILDIFDPDGVYVKKELEGKWVEITLDNWGGWITKRAKKKGYAFPQKQTKLGKAAVVKLIIEGKNVFLDFKQFILKLSEISIWSSRKKISTPISPQQLETCIGNKHAFIEIAFVRPWPKLGSPVKMIK